MTDRLIEEERVPLTVLAVELGVDRKTVSRWADEGYKGQRLESFRIGKKRHSTWPAAKRFLAAVNKEPETSATEMTGTCLASTTAE